MERGFQIFIKPENITTLLNPIFFWFDIGIYYSNEVVMKLFV